MFGDKNSAAIYLDRNKIVFADPEKQILVEQPLDKEIFNHLEVRNEEKFTQVVKSFLEQFPSDTVVVFLGKHLLFEREIEKSKETDPEKGDTVEKFLSMVPIAKPKLATKLLEGDASTLCIATNKEYYQLVIKSAELSSKKVVAVVPAFMFGGLENDGVFAPEGVESALADKQILTQSNFMDSNTTGFAEEPVKSAESSPEAQTSEAVQSNTKTIVLTIILIALLSFSLIFSYMNGLFDRFFSTTPNLGPTPAPIASVAEVNPTMDAMKPEPTATLSAITMEDLRAKITNGTGVVGQASRAQDALTALRMKETLLDPVASKGATVTRLDYDPRVPRQLMLDVKIKLQTLFEKVEEKEASDTGEFDFLILTGKEKAQ